MSYMKNTIIASPTHVVSTGGSTIGPSYAGATITSTTLDDTVWHSPDPVGMHDLVYREPKHIPPRVLTAHARVHKATFADKPEIVKERIKYSLTKQLFKELVDSGMIKITSEVNPKSGSVTFTATIACHDDRA